MNASVYILDDQDVSVILTALESLKAQSLSTLAAVREKLEAPVKSGSESPSGDTPIVDPTQNPDDPALRPQHANCRHSVTPPTDDTPLTPEDVRFRGYPCHVIETCERIWDASADQSYAGTVQTVRRALGGKCPNDTTLRRWHKQWKKATENTNSINCEAAQAYDRMKRRRGPR